MSSFFDYASVLNRPVSLTLSRPNIVKEEVNQEVELNDIKLISTNEKLMDTKFPVHKLCHYKREFTSPILVEVIVSPYDYLFQPMEKGDLRLDDSVAKS